MVLSQEKRQQLYWPYVEIMKDCRTNVSLSQAKLAKDADLSPKYVTLIEGGRRCPSLESLLALMASSGVERATAEALVKEVLDNFEWEG